MTPSVSRHELVLTLTESPEFTDRRTRTAVVARPDLPERSSRRFRLHGLPCSMMA